MPAASIQAAAMQQSAVHGLRDFAGGGGEWVVTPFPGFCTCCFQMSRIWNESLQKHVHTTGLSHAMFALCRVYLIGGAEATGSSNDTALVYTPVYYANYDGQRHMMIWNATLPLHFFSRAPSNLEAGKHSLSP